MNLKESISIKTTPAPKKMRNVPGYWNWPDLIALAEKVLKTGETQSGRVSDIYYAVVTPDYHITEEKRTPKYLATHEKVRVSLYSLWFTFSVEKGETIQPEWLQKNKELVERLRQEEKDKEFKPGQVVDITEEELERIKHNAGYDYPRG